MPYRIDIRHPPPDVLDLVVRLGALDIESTHSGIAAILPDHVTRDVLTGVLDVSHVTVSLAIARDNGSVWLLSPQPVRAGSLLVASPDEPAPSTAMPKTIRLLDSHVFGTGHHPTTALCMEAMEDAMTAERPDGMLDVGIGSGILAIAALATGVPQAVGLDIDADALKISAENARLNGVADRLQLVLGGPDAVGGAWPMVVANVLAAPLMEMAPVLVRRVGKRGRLILSGIPQGLASEIRHVYQHFGMRHLNSRTRDGWTALVIQASW